MATRVGLRLFTSTRGLAPFWICLARWAATVMNAELAVHVTRHDQMRETQSSFGKRIQYALGRPRPPARSGSGRRG